MTVVGEHRHGGPVCVIGGTSGIGLAVARELRRDGRPVTVVGRRAQHGRRMAAEIGATFYRADCTDPDQMSEFASSTQDGYGIPTGLVVSGGGAEAVSRHVTETTAADVQAMFVAQFLGRILPIMTFVPLMAQRSYGKVVLVSTVAGLTPSRPQWLAGALAGAAQQASRSLAAEFAAAGVRINVVALTLVRDSGFDLRRREGALDPEVIAMMDKVAGRLPLGPPDLDDAVAAIVHLLGPRSDATTGSVVPLSGGLVF